MDERLRGDGRRGGRAAPGSRARVARSRLPAACAARSLRCVQRPISVAPVVLVEVVEDRVGVQRDDPVDERRVAREARLVPELRPRLRRARRAPARRPAVRRTEGARCGGAGAAARRSGRAPHGRRSRRRATSGRSSASAPERRKERLSSRPSGRACRRRCRAPRGRCPATPSRKRPSGSSTGSSRSRGA